MYQEAWKRMLEAEHIVVVSHVHPDGDTLGSALAMYDVLKRAGKKYHITIKTVNFPLPMIFYQAMQKLKIRFQNSLIWWCVAIVQHVIDSKFLMVIMRSSTLIII